MRPPTSDVALYRAALRDVTTLAQQTLVREWRQVDFANANRARDALLDIVPSIVTGYHLQAATVAADWYDVVRSDAGVRKSFSAVMPEPPDAQQGTALVRWGISPLYRASPDPGVALVKVAGGLQRIVTNGGRQAVVASTRADPARVGWVRVGAGGCGWCQQYLDGEVHYTTGYDFQAHDHCQCDAVPEFG